jgi:hypothetical protein
VESPGSAFNATTYLINPGDSATFPWLAGVVQNFEQWQPLGIVFYFNSTSATAIGSTNTALGTVIMATDYDVYDLPYTTKQEMEMSEFAVACKPSESMLHPVECKGSLNPLKRYYIRHAGVVVNGADQRFNDLGRFHIATSGQQGSGAVLGELWVSYHIRLFKPCIPASLSNPTAFSRFALYGSTNNAAGTLYTWIKDSYSVAPAGTLTFTTFCEQNISAIFNEVNHPTSWNEHIVFTPRLPFVGPVGSVPGSTLIGINWICWKGGTGSSSGPSDPNNPSTIVSRVSSNNSAPIIHPSFDQTHPFPGDASVFMAGKQIQGLQNLSPERSSLVSIASWSNYTGTATTATFDIFPIELVSTASRQVQQMFMVVEVPQGVDTASWNLTDTLSTLPTAGVL